MPNVPRIYLHLIFEISSLMNLIIFSYFELDFCRLDSSKNQVQNRPKIKFNKLNFSNLIFQNQAQIDRGIKVHTMNLTIIFLFFEIYNVNYKGEVRTLYLSFREKNDFKRICLTQLSLLRGSQIGRAT